MSDILTTTQAAKVLGVHPGSMRRLPLSPIGKVGRAWAYAQQDVNDFAKTYVKSHKAHNNNHMQVFHTCPHCGRKIRGIVYERHVKVCPDTYNIEQAAQVVGVSARTMVRLFNRHGIIPIADVYPSKQYSKTIVDLLANSGAKYDD